jgi:AP2-associated kinase
MEYCSGNGLIGFMNTRLRTLLSEPEILKIACDIGLAIANMHYLSPPLIHRDLKVENVLISGDNTFKLCDFGSASSILRPPRNSAEFQILDNDIQSHTTAQYRAPEMIDIARGYPINEKCDIWAFGVFIYKLCYFTTPFEKEGNLAILNASFSFPPNPVFSDRLKRFINVTLSGDPNLRPNIFQCVKELYSMRGLEAPIQDIYVAPTSSTWRNAVSVDNLEQTLPIQDTQPLDNSAPPALTPRVGIVKATPAVAKPEKPIPAVKPMYRGRPQANPDTAKVPASVPGTPPVPLRKFKTTGDPFTIADSVDETTYMESKYPSIEALTQSLTQQSFEFSSPSKSANSPDQPVSIEYRTVQYQNNFVPNNGVSPRPVMVTHSMMTSPIQSRSTTPASKSDTFKKSSGVNEIDISSSSSEEEEEIPVAKHIERPSPPPSRNRQSGEISRPQSVPSLQVEEASSSISYKSLPPLPKRRQDTSSADPAEEETERDKLKVLLTGLSEKSQTVYLGEEDCYSSDDGRDNNGRSRRFKNENSLSVGEKLRARSRSRSRHAKSASMALKNKFKIPDDGKEIEGSSSEDEDLEPKSRTKAEDKRKSFEAEALVRATSFMESEDASKFKPKTKSDEKRQSFEAEALVRATSFMESEDASKFKRPPPARKPEPRDSSETTQAVRRPKAIQSRLQAFINREPSPPPRRSATGYGFYTDEAQRQQEEENIIDTPTNSNNNSQNGRTSPIKLVSAISTEERIGAKAPPLPSKPKHLQSLRKA